MSKILIDKGTRFRYHFMDHYALWEVKEYKNKRWICSIVEEDEIKDFVGFQNEFTSKQILNCLKK